MTEIILKNDIEDSKLYALLNFLRSFDIDAEIKTAKKTTSIASFFGVLERNDAETMLKEIDIDWTK